MCLPHNESCGARGRSLEIGLKSYLSQNVLLGLENEIDTVVQELAATTTIVKSVWKKSVLS